MEEFAAGHIPEAHQVDWEDWCESAPDAAPLALRDSGYWGKLDHPESRATMQKLQMLRINNRSKVVVYADGARSKGREGRLAWMLLYLGVKNVSILDGGWRAWQASPEKFANGGLIATATGALPIEIDKNRRALRSDVEDLLLGGAAAPLLIDTRSSREFAGEIYHYQPKLGRINKAINLPYRSLLRANGQFITKAQYIQLLEARGLRPERLRNSIWYCEVGVRAAMAALLHECYLGEVMRVYDGSFMEWSLENPKLVSRG
jgi:thiosulfate/3-mercaptopyruvate sulfurtransferase